MRLRRHDRDFALLVAGSVALGSASASNSLSRYASTDLAPPDRRATALSLVVWTGTAGAVAGPLLVPAAEQWASHHGLPPLAGPFLFAMVSTTGAALILFAFLRRTHSWSLENPRASTTLATCQTRPPEPPSER